MPDFITLTCPSCGGKLQITDKIYTFACVHCRNEYVVNREGGMIYLAPMAQDVRQIRVGVDKTVAELAVARLSKEIEVLEQQRRSLLERPEVSAKWIGCGCLLVCGFAVLSLTSLQAMDSRNAALGAFFLTIFAVWAVVRLLAYQDRQDGKGRTLQAEQISSDIESKRTQLHKNQQIVNS